MAAFKSWRPPSCTPRRGGAALKEVTYFMRQSCHTCERCNFDGGEERHGTVFAKFIICLCTYTLYRGGVGRNGFWDFFLDKISFFGGVH